MNDTVIQSLYQVILERKANPTENSYTCYLFAQGLDKILKKVGEEAAETIIAAKNEDNALLCGEICDLLYHLLVLCAARDLEVQSLFEELNARAKKIGNLKPKHEGDTQS